jgi:VanZ family protein
MSSLSTSTSSTSLRFLPALAWMGLIFYLSDQPRLPEVPTLTGDLTSILGHFCAYFGLAVLLWWALVPFGLSARQRVLLALAGAVLYGVTDEWHQSFVPGRTPDVKDILVDAIGATVGLIIVTSIARSRRFGHLIP